jgi:cation diffusion facilitator family transporter
MNPSEPDHALAAHRHGHNFLGGSHDAHERRTRWVVALTALMMVGEIVAGSIFGSMALLADGIHMATHAGALTVAAAAYAFARRRTADPLFTFGTGKVGDLAGFASALTLALVALAVGVESVQRLFEPARVAFGEAIAVALLGLVVNILSAWLLGHGPDHAHRDHGHDAHEHSHDHGHHHAREHRPARGHHHDNNLRSAYFHVLADALTSVLAIVALLAGLYLHWLWLDPAMGIVGAVVIARWAWGLMRDTSAVLLDRLPDTALAEEITDAIESDGDARVSDLHLWQVGPACYSAIVALVAQRPAPPSAYKARLAYLHRLVHVTVEANPASAPETTALR